MCLPQPQEFEFPDKIPVQFQRDVGFLFCRRVFGFHGTPHGTICSTYLRAAPFYVLRKKFCNVQFRGKRFPQMRMDPERVRSELFRTALGLYGLEYVGVELGGAPST